MYTSVTYRCQKIYHGLEYMFTVVYIFGGNLINM